MPVLRARCLRCHRDTAPPSPLARLQETAELEEAYVSLLGAVWPGSARTSPLVRRLLGLDGRQAAETEGEGPTTDHSRLLDEEERRLLVEWVDLGAQWSSDVSLRGEP